MQTVYAFSYTPGIATGTATAGTVWRMTYQQNINLYQGTVNTVRFVVFNNSQKVVNLTNYNVEIQIVDREAKRHYITKTLSVASPISGIAELEFSATELNGLDNRYYHMIARLVDPDDGSSYANAEILYLDDNYGVFLPLQIESAWNLTP